MNVIGIILLCLVIFIVFSAWNFRRIYPKATPLGRKKEKLEIRQLRICAGGHELYGELLLPKEHAGKLPTIICSHGFNGSYQYYRRYVGKSLAMSGYAVFCFDFYGGSRHGKSGGSTLEMSIFSEREQLQDIITHIKTMDFVDNRNFFLFGESQGAFVTALTAAWHTEDVKAMVLYYPAFSIVDDMKKHYPTLDEMPEQVALFGQKLSKAYYEELYDFDAYAETQKYTNPVLIIHGDADRTVNMVYGKRAAQSYQNAQFEVLPGQDHGFNAKGKVAAAELTYNFLREQVEEK